MDWSLDLWAILWDQVKTETWLGQSKELKYWQWNIFVFLWILTTPHSRDRRKYTSKQLKTHKYIPLIFVASWTTQYLLPETSPSQVDTKETLIWFLLSPDTFADRMSKASCWIYMTCEMYYEGKFVYTVRMSLSLRDNCNPNCSWDRVTYYSCWIIITRLLFHETIFAEIQIFIISS